MTDPTTNGFHPALDGQNHSAATTPAALDSPATPISTEHTDQVKIDLGIDTDPARHAELVSLKNIDVLSAQPQVGTPIDPGMLSRVVDALPPSQRAP